ncbi:hypothetical protein DMH20_03230 [Escherichia coli]|nr:hypothetical protein [Escherichia coli]
MLQARGWHRAAENELKKAEVIEPRNINLEVEQAWTALTLQEGSGAAVLTHDVVEREPQDPGVVRLKRAVDVHNLAELRIAGSTGIDAEGRMSGKHDVDLTTIVYSPPLKDNWRGFAGFGYADGQFSEEKGLFATGWRVLSGGHVISGSRRSTLNAFSIMSINPARACLAGMILMITGVLVRNWNASLTAFHYGQKKWCYRQQCSGLCSLVSK